MASARKGIPVSWRLFWPILLLAGSPALGAEALPRKILALYRKSSVPGEAKDIASTDIHRLAEMPLNHLGMDLVYRDVEETLPEPEGLAGYRGVLTWFLGGDRVPQPATYCRWLSRLSAAGLKIVVMGEPGVFPGEGPAHAPECRKAFAELGVEFGALVRPEPGLYQFSRKEASMVEFERRLDMREVPVLRRARAVGPGKTRLRLRCAAEPEFAADPVVTSPRGGVALSPFIIYSSRLQTREVLAPKAKEMLEYFSETGGQQFRWRLNPFDFFEEAFGLEGWPRPDVTTLNGRRLLFFHVDGDGFFNVSEKDHRSWSAQVFLDEVLKRHPDFPVTLGLITGYFDMPRYGTKKALDLARTMLALPNVEGASHGYAHPLNWRKKILGLSIPGYRYDARKEILGSLDFINDRLMPPGKKAGLFQWTGNCRPLAHEVALASQGGVLNLNGGDPRFDSRYDSLAFLSPLSRPLGRARQIYAAGSNENTYTGLWRGPHYGYREAVESFSRTESPRRLKPVDVYVHLYSAEKASSLKALEGVLAWAESGPHLPVFASEYARMARDFFEVSIARLGPGLFRLEGGGEARTVRFDREGRDVDLSRSKGVLGFKRHQGSLYVFLTEESVREVALGKAAKGFPYVVEAPFQIARWRAGPSGARFERSGGRAGGLVLGGLSAGRWYEVREGREVRRARSGPDGFLRVTLRALGPAEPPSTVEVLAR